MVVLRDVKSLQRLESRHDRTREHLGFVKLANIGFRYTALLIVGNKNGGAILTSHVISLPVEVSWIMGDREVNLQQLSESRLAGIVSDLDSLRMISVAAANSSIVGGRRTVARITASN